MAFKVIADTLHRLRQDDPGSRIGNDVHGKPIGHVLDSVHALGKTDGTSRSFWPPIPESVQRSPAPAQVVCC